MNILQVMQWLGLTWSMKQLLLKHWVAPSDLEGVDFNSMSSLNQMAQKVMPGLLKKNPQIAKMIKECGWLQWEQKEQVNNVIDGL